MFDIPHPPDVPVTTDQRRSLLWLSYCEHTAVLPWVRQVLRLAQAVEDGAKYRHTQRVLERLIAKIADLVDQLWARDPEWCHVPWDHVACPRVTPSGSASTMPLRRSRRAHFYYNTFAARLMR